MRKKMLKFLEELRQKGNILDEKTNFYHSGWSVWNNYEAKPEPDCTLYSIKLSSPTYATMRDYSDRGVDIVGDITKKIREKALKHGIKLIFDVKMCHQINPDRVQYIAEVRPVTENKYTKIYENMQEEIKAILEKDPDAIIITAQQQPKKIESLPGAIYLNPQKYLT